MAPLSARPSVRTWATVLASVALGFGLARCGASGTPAPDLDPADQPKPSSCKSTREMMPNFFRMLDDPSMPLKGLRDVVVRLSAGDSGGEDAVSGLLSNVTRGLSDFTKDPPEGDGLTCLPSLPAAPLCAVEATPGEACENRMCDLRRALDLGIRDEQAKTALNDLQPILVKLLGYVSNHGPGADGRTHYEIIDVFHKTSSYQYEGICAPEHLLEVTDGIVTYFRASQACGDECPGRLAIKAIRTLIEDPQFNGFLTKFQSGESGSSGREAWQKLMKGMGPSLEQLPEDEHYFDSIDTLVEQIDKFLDTDTQKYGQLKTELHGLVEILRAFLDPGRPGAILHPLKQVVYCIDHVDTDEELVGGLYDLLSKPGGQGQDGLDLDELVTAVDNLSSLDKDGVLFGAAHAVLASTENDEQAADTLRQMLSDLLTEQNAEEAIPTLQAMISNGVINEIVAVLDNLLYGCKTDGT